MRMDRRAGLLAAGESAIGTWVFGWAVSFKPNGTQYNINFTSNGANYSRIYFFDNYAKVLLYDDTTAYNDNGGWAKSAYKTIVITGGTDATNPDLLTWLKNNATRS